MPIELRQVRKVYNQGKDNECVAVDGVSLLIEQGRITVFKGPSGSGKTSLLSIIGCMARPTSGRVWVAEREVTSLPERFLTEIRRTTFGFIFQQYHLIRGLSALENVMLSSYPVGESYVSLKKRASRLLELFDLGHKTRSRVEWLSGGEAQRVAIARALINDPKVVIADEPTAHLDSRLSGEFMDTMRQLNQEGRTILVASHDAVVCDAAGVDRLIEVRDGKI